MRRFDVFLECASGGAGRGAYEQARRQAVVTVYEARAVGDATKSKSDKIVGYGM